MPKSFTTSLLDRTNIQQVANLHTRVFPDYFLTHLGISFLELFYQQFTERPGYGVAACIDDRVVGFVTGTTDPSLFYKRFYKKHFLKLGLITFTKAIGDSVVRKLILSRALHIKKAVQSIIPSLSSMDRHSNQKELISTSTARLLSIGVDPNYRGRGIAEEITDEFCEQLRKDGIEIVGLSVFNDNHRAIQFYKKSGWQVEFLTENSTYFIRSI